MLLAKAIRDPSSGSVSLAASGLLLATVISSTYLASVSGHRLQLMLSC